MPEITDQHHSGVEQAGLALADGNPPNFIEIYPLVYNLDHLWAVRWPTHYGAVHYIAFEGTPEGLAEAVKHAAGRLVEDGGQGGEVHLTRGGDLVERWIVPDGWLAPEADESVRTVYFNEDGHAPRWRRPVSA